MDTIVEDQIEVDFAALSGYRRLLHLPESGWRPETVPWKALCGAVLWDVIQVDKHEHESCAKCDEEWDRQWASASVVVRLTMMLQKARSGGTPGEHSEP